MYRIFNPECTIFTYLSYLIFPYYISTFYQEREFPHHRNQMITLLLIFAVPPIFFTLSIIIFPLHQVNQKSFYHLHPPSSYFLNQKTLL